MKKFFAVSCLCLKAAFGADITVTWQDAINPTGTTYNIYSKVVVPPVTCTQTMTLTKVNTTPITVFTYKIVNTPPGTYCIAATATNGTNESLYSVIVPAVVPVPTPAAVTNVTATVTQ